MRRILSHVSEESLCRVFEYYERCKDTKSCPVCGVRMISDCGKLLRNVCVDHYHEKEDDRGQIRALICASCNVKEGKIRKMVEEGGKFEVLVEKYGYEYVCNIQKLYMLGGGVMPMELG